MSRVQLLTASKAKNQAPGKESLPIVDAGNLWGGEYLSKGRLLSHPCLSAAGESLTDRVEGPRAEAAQASDSHPQENASRLTSVILGISLVYS